MKRSGHLFPRIVARDNLRLAYHKARRGRRAQRHVRAFGERLEEQLSRMAEELKCGTMVVGEHRQFTIHDPKQRLITAPAFRERVLHHAIMNVCEPLLERCLIVDTFACRRGKGRIAALLRARQMARRHGFFLKMDIRKYFDNIAHAVLVEKLQRLFKDERLLELFRKIITSYATAPGRGVPIGSLTSQHFANFYLGSLDHFVKESLRVKAYVRYMDDFVLWADSTAVLKSYVREGTAYLADELRLEVKARPYLNGTQHGMDFLGCRVFADTMQLNHRSKVRFRRKLAALERLFLEGQIDEGQLQQRATALVAFTRTAGVASWRFRARVLQQLPVSGHGLQPGDPGR